MIRSERAGSGHRRYPRVVLRTDCLHCVCPVKMGLNLEEIATELLRSSRRTASRRPPIGLGSSASWSGRIDERIAELQRACAMD